MRLKQAVVYAAIAVFVAALPFLWPLLPPAADALGNGTDDKARNAIREVAPDYRPWFESLWRPSTPETERLLFTVQALAGTLVFIAAFRALREK